MKVLIVKVSALGDVVHALPVLSYLHAVVPGITVDWLVEKSFAPILEGHPLINQVISLDTKGWRRQGTGASIKGALAAIKMLRSQSYDVALDLQGNSKSGLFTGLSGAPRRFGFDKTQAREWPNLLATTDKVSLPPEVHHIGLRYLQIARTAFPSDASVPLAGPLEPPVEVREKVSVQLQQAGLVPGQFLVAHYGTTWTTKLWPLQSWCQLVAHLTGAGRDVVLTWGNEEEKCAAETIRQQSGQQAQIWPRGTLMELVALLQQAGLVVGADTGPVHIAAAVGTPTVSFYRVTDGRRNGPEGESHIRLQAPLECSPCLRKSCERDEECSLSISVDAAREAIEELLKSES